MEMKTEYRRDLQQSWMILSGGEVPEKEAYPVRMLTENRIHGLLPCKAVSLDGELRFYYDISSRHAFRTVLETEQVGQLLLERLLCAVAEMLECLSEYLLDPDGLLLDPKYVFWNPERSEIRFCWYPGKNMQFREQAKILGGALLAQLDQSDRAGVVMGYQFYQYCESGELTPGAIRSMLRPKQPVKEVRPATKEEIERAAVLDSFFDEPEESESTFGSFGSRVKSWFTGKRKKKDFDNLYETEKPFEAEKRYETEKSFEAEKRYETEITFDPEKRVSVAEPETIYEKYPDWAVSKQVQTMSAAYGRGGESATTMLTPDMLIDRGDKVWKLRVKEGAGKEREIPLTGEVYYVGKKGSDATLQLDSSAVSRLHAKLEKNGENWCLTDLNSRNGTRRIRAAEGTAGALLQPEEIVVLQEGDVIWFADVMCLVTK